MMGPSAGVGLRRHINSLGFLPVAQTERNCNPHRRAVFCIPAGIEGHKGKAPLFICIVISAIMEESRVILSLAIQFSPKPCVQYSQLLFCMEPMFPIFHNRNQAVKSMGKVVNRFPGCQMILPGVENHCGAFPFRDSVFRRIAQVFPGE